MTRPTDEEIAELVKSRTDNEPEIRFFARLIAQKVERYTEAVDACDKVRAQGNNGEVLKKAESAKRGTRLQLDTAHFLLREALYGKGDTAA